jgi:hypothetical protein
VNSGMEKGVCGASSLPIGWEGTKSRAEQQRPDHVDKQANAGGESGGK